jgi:DNA anti-recombination protein RmuC
MNVTNIKPISFSYQVKNFVSIFLLSLLSSSLLFMVLILAGVDRNLAALLAFVLMITCQLYIEAYQYRLLRQDTDFLKGLNKAIPDLLRELAALSARVAVRRQQVAEQLEHLADQLSKYYSRRKQLVDQQFKGRVYTAQLQRLDAQIAQLQQQEAMLYKEQEELGRLRNELDKQSKSLERLQRDSTDVIREMIRNLRVNLITKIQQSFEELRQQQVKLLDQGNRIVTVPATIS